MNVQFSKTIMLVLIVAICKPNDNDFQIRPLIIELSYIYDIYWYRYRPFQIKFKKGTNTRTNWFLVVDFMVKIAIIFLVRNFMIIWSMSFTTVLSKSIVISKRVANRTGSWYSHARCVHTAFCGWYLLGQTHFLSQTFVSFEFFMFMWFFQ